MNANIGSNVFYGDSSYALQLDEIKDKKSKSSKKLCITIGILAGIVIITTTVLLVVFLTKKSKNKHKIVKSNSSTKQSIELSIELNQDSTNRRNLQESQQVQILGESFEGINPSNANIYINGKKNSFY